MLPAKQWKPLSKIEKNIVINEFSFLTTLKTSTQHTTQRKDGLGDYLMPPPPRCREPHEGASTPRSLQRYLERRPATSCHRRRQRRNEATKRTDLNYKQQKSTGSATGVVFLNKGPKFFFFGRPHPKREKRCSKTQRRWDKTYVWFVEVPTSIPQTLA